MNAAELSLNARASTHGTDAALPYVKTTEIQLNASSSTPGPDAAWQDVDGAEAEPSPQAAALLKRYSMKITRDGSIRLRVPLAVLPDGAFTELLSVIE